MRQLGANRKRMGIFSVLALYVFGMPFRPLTAFGAEQPQRSIESKRPAATAATDLSPLIAADDEPWTMALAAPAAAAMRQVGGNPLVLAVSSPPTHEADWLLSLVPGRRPIILMPSDGMKLTPALEGRSPELLRIGTDPVEASVAVARRFWKSAKDVIVADPADKEAAILGSALASAWAVPLLLCDRAEASPSLRTCLADMAVKQIHLATSDRTKAPAWLGSVSIPSEVLAPSALQHRLVASLGAANIRNIIVARVPEERAEVGRSAWLAPYISLSRGSPVVLIHAVGAGVAEADVKSLIRRESLHIHTVTILADYASIGYNYVDLGPGGAEEGRAVAPPTATTTAPTTSPRTAQSASLRAGSLSVSTSSLLSVSTSAAVAAPPVHYTVRTEPFVPQTADRVVEFGIGRIPLESLGDASVFFARGLVRERLLPARAPRLLMIANSGINRKPLPLCETISRVTASEFKNFGIHVDEFYGKMANTPEILDAAGRANLILYEGHLAYQDLIDVPVLRRASPELSLDEGWEELEGTGARGTAAAVPVADEPVPSPHPAPVEPSAMRLQSPLTGLPIVVLQSCDSLDDAVLWRLDELGGAALIGSVTPIHSGCGSSLLHAAMNSLLYRGGTLGEVLRDAQNYMLCVEDLKSHRGHKEQAKGVRVAMSFRLWGDPELTVFPMPIGVPLQPPVSATWARGDRLQIHIPSIRLPEARSNKFTAEMFPYSQAAGLIKPHEADALKMLSPVYYFCLPLPLAAGPADAFEIEPSKSDSHRVGVRVDRAAGVVYVVYYPDVESPGATVVIHLVRRQPPERVGSWSQGR